MLYCFFYVILLNELDYLHYELLLILFKLVLIKLTKKSLELIHIFWKTFDNSQKSLIFYDILNAVTSIWIPKKFSMALQDSPMDILSNNLQTLEKFLRLSLAHERWNWLFLLLEVI